MQDLMNYSGASCNVSKVTSSFWVVDIIQVSNLPIREGRYNLVWSLEKDDVYTVKSGYLLGTSLQAKELVKKGMG